MASMKVPESTMTINMRLLNRKIRTYESTFAFAQNHCILPTALTCPCGSYVDKFKIEEKKNGWRSAYFKCHQKKCKTKVNIRKKTLFENCKLKMHQVFILMYTFTQFLTYDKVIAEASDIPIVSSTLTVASPTSSMSTRRLGGTLSPDTSLSSGHGFVCGPWRTFPISKLADLDSLLK